MEYEQYETILYNSSLLIEIKKEELKQLESDLKKISDEFKSAYFDDDDDEFYQAGF